jgi:DNA-binding beta-propeller fold protein YncE
LRLPDGCVSETGTGGACADGVALDNPFSVTVSPDGSGAYVTSSLSNAVAVLDRELAPSPPTPADEFAFGKLKRNANKGIAHLQVLLPGPGQIGYRGRGEQGGAGSRAGRSREVGSAGGAWFKIKPGRFGSRTKTIRAKLKRGKGSVKVKVFVTYVPSGGSAETKARKLTLVRR